MALSVLYVRRCARIARGKRGGRKTYQKNINHKHIPPRLRDWVQPELSRSVAILPISVVALLTRSI